MFDETSPRFRLIAFATITLVVCGGLWAAVNLMWPEDTGQLAILKADNAPFKTKPDQQGGMQIPHQDKLVFNTVSSEGKVVTVERILPPPEQPMLATEPAPAPQPNVIQQAAAMTQAQVQAQQQAQNVQPAPSIPTPTAPAPVAMGRVVEPAPVPPTVIKTADKKTIDAPAPAAFDVTKTAALPEKKPKEPAKIEAPVTEPKSEADVAQEDVAEEAPAKLAESQESEAPVKASSGKNRFQIASFFDRPSAEKSLAGMNTKYADVLNGSALFITQAKIGGGKPVFRIQGSAPSASEVSTICSGIKAKGGACVLARP